MRRNPMCFDASTDKCDFDASELIEGSTAFDIGDVADQIIESSVETPGGETETIFTAKGKELVKLCPHPTQDGCKTLDISRYVGIIPPFDNCFFEYPTTKYAYSAVDCGIHVLSMPQEWIAAKYPGEGFEHFMLVTIFFRFVINGVSKAGRETVATIASDSEGRVVDYQLVACLPDGVDRSLRQNWPQSAPFIVLLVALMMLNCGILKSTAVEPTPKSRQQRRYEERHPDRARPPLVRYYVLDIDSEKTGTAATGASKKGAWEQAWHEVRGHLRHLKSGRVVPVRPHAKGNPLKGILLKGYKLHGGNAA
jgi:hypothetical protein